VAGNSERWKGIVPEDEVWVDWSYSPLDAAHDLQHELSEYFLMRSGWSYSRAHRYANWGPGMEMDFLLQLRPELRALKPKEDL
jgi:hypothetical protein